MELGGTGLCASRSAPENNECADVPGTEATEVDPNRVVSSRAFSEDNSKRAAFDGCGVRELIALDGHVAGGEAPAKHSGGVAARTHNDLATTEARTTRTGLRM